jgi:phenylalanyl-tRNA synthetase beta chain
MNPEQECLRTSLRGNVLQALSSNIRREEGPVLLFELGRVYLPKTNDLPEEPEMLCAVLTSAGPDKRWHGRKEAVDFYDAKGAVESLLSELNVSYSFAPSQDAGLRPGYQAEVLIGGKAVGVLGELHPAVSQAFELPDNSYLVEINMSLVMPEVNDYEFKQLPRFPAVERDLALVVDEQVTYQQIADIIKQFRLVNSLRLFDVYTGKQVAAGKKSLAYSLSFQSPDHTLKDAEVDGVMTAIVRKLSTELGAALRN